MYSIEIFKKKYLVFVSHTNIMGSEANQPDGMKKYNTTQPNTVFIFECVLCKFFPFFSLLKRDAPVHYIITILLTHLILARLNPLKHEIF